jgi:type IV secretion system protein VirB9
LTAPAPAEEDLPAWPPLPAFVGTDPPLSAKEWEGARLAAEWMELPSKPRKGRDGRLLYLYGHAMPSLVCAPLQVCTIELQAGEQVQDVHLGDTAQWQVMPARSGPEAARVTYVVIKPLEIGLQTSLLVTTDRRPYHIKLISREKEFMPRVAFVYGDEMAQQWAAYQQTQQEARERQTLPETGHRLSELEFDYRLVGEAPWKPLRVYNDGVKTYIQMPHAMAQREAPALLVLSGKTAQLVNYRLHGDRYIVDQVFDKAMLVAGLQQPYPPAKTQLHVLVTESAVGLADSLAQVLRDSGYGVVSGASSETVPITVYLHAPDEAQLLVRLDVGETYQWTRLYARRGPGGLEPLSGPTLRGQ